MIIDYLLNLSFSFMHLLVGLFPTAGSFPSAVGTAVDYLSQFVHIFDFMLPTDTLFQAILFMLTVRLVIFFFHTIVWFRNMLNPLH